jgi:hypothetical protein
VPKGRYPRKLREGRSQKTSGRGGSRSVLCPKCTQGMGLHNWRTHYRRCVLRMRCCPVCRGRFPCDNDLCPWYREPPMGIPDHLAPYFYAEDRDEFPELELEALALVREARRAWGLVFR